MAQNLFIVHGYILWGQNLKNLKSSGLKLDSKNINH